MSDHRRLPQIFGAQQHAGATELDFGADREADCGIDHLSTLSGREGWHVGPAPGEVEPHGS
jgi:hypothetical protein